MLGAIDHSQLKKKYICIKQLNFAKDTTMYHSFSHIVFILAPSRLLQTQARDAYWSEQQDDEVTYSGAEKLYRCTQCVH